MSRRYRLYFGGFAGSSLLLVGALLMALRAGLSALAGGVSASEEFVLLAALGAAAEWLVLAVLLGLAAAGFLLATVVSLLRATSLHRDDRLVSAVELLEQKYPVLRQFDASERVEPTTEDRRQQLTEQYVEGEVTEEEFEREMAQLLDEDGDDPETDHRSG